MNLNRNQPRKDIPNTILGFLEAKRQWHSNSKSPEPFLYLHCNPKDPMGHDLRGVMLQFPELVEGKDYMFPSKDEENHGSPIEKLNKIYNSVDLYITTSLGEGWGLGFTEAAATKLPIICPLHTSFIEMSDFGRRAFLLDELVPYVNSIDNILRKQTNYEDVSESILIVSGNLLGYNEDLNGLKNTENTVRRAYEWAKKLNWNDVCKDWIFYFEQTFKI